MVENVQCFIGFHPLPQSFKKAYLSYPLQMIHVWFKAINYCYTPCNEVGKCITVFNPSVSQSFSPPVLFFVNATPFKPLHGIL